MGFGRKRFCLFADVWGWYKTEFGFLFDRCFLDFINLELWLVGFWFWVWRFACFLFSGVWLVVWLSGVFMVWFVCLLGCDLVIMFVAVWLFGVVGCLVGCLNSGVVMHCCVVCLLVGCWCFLLLWGFSCLRFVCLVDCLRGCLLFLIGDFRVLLLFGVLYFRLKIGYCI